MSCQRGRILYCNCTYARVVPKETKAAVLDGLADSGLAFDAVPDLCELAARCDPALERLTAGDGPLQIVACYPRAVRWLFHAAGTPLPETGVTVHNMRAEDADTTLRAVLGAPDEPRPEPRDETHREPAPESRPAEALP